MSKVMQMRDLKNKVSRNGFDLSEDNMFTAKCGELLPFYVKEVLPGDKWKIGFSTFTRTAPAQSAAFTKLKEYVDYYYVPYHLLWRFAPETFAATNQSSHAVSSVKAMQTTTALPYFSMNALHTVYENFSAASSAIRSLYNNGLGFSAEYRIRKLMWYLGYGDLYGMGTPRIDSRNIFRVLAYNKIWNDFYRFSQWQSDQAQLYNVDYLYNGASIGLQFPIIPTSVSTTYNSTLASYIDMFGFKYSCWEKDFFMGLLPSPQFGHTAEVQLMDSLGNYVETDNNVVAKQFSVLDLRKAEFTQKWREITQSGRYDYQAQIKKHWNVDVPDFMSDRCTYIGGNTSMIGFNEVVNQNLADGNNADIKGRATGSGNGTLTFDAKYHGVIIGIYHCVPMLCYDDAHMIDIHTTKLDVFDYAQPEFDRLGMQPTMYYQLDEQRGIEVSSGSGMGVIGYAPRYQEYKTSFDKVRGDFTESLSSWAAPMSQSMIKNLITTNSGNSALKSNFFLCNPHVMDNVFGVAAASTIATDNLYVEINTSCGCVRNLDYDGLPYNA